MRAEGGTPAWADEERLAALYRTGLLDTLPEQGFDDIVRLATRLCGAPVALVSLVDRDRQWFKARFGFPPCETDLDRSVCKFVLVEPDLLVIPDLTADPRTASNPLVTEAPRIRFYAGAPLRSPDGHVLGSLCVIDTETRPSGLTADQADDLRALGRQVSDLMEARRAVKHRDQVLDRQRAELRQARYLDVLAKASQALLSATDPAAVLDPILSASAGTLGFDRSYTYDIWPDGRALRLTHSLNATAEVQAYLHRMPYGQPLCGVVAESCRPLVLTGVQASTEPGHQAARCAGIDGYAGFPIMSRGSLRGVISFGSTQAPAFDAEALAFFETLARLMSGVHERLDGERTQRESEERLRLVIEGAEDHAILTTDAAGFVTSWSAGAQATFGWSGEEIVGQPVAAIFTPEDRAAGVPPRELATARREGRSADARWHLAKDGRRVFMNGSVHPLPRDAQGRERGFLKIARDETRRRHDEEALRASEALVQANAQRVQLALAAGAIIGTWFWDVAADHFTVDEAFARAFGLDPALGCVDLSLEQVIATVHPDDRPGVVEAIDAAVARGGAYAHQYRTRRADGHYRWLEANGRVDHAPDGTPLSFPGVLIDVEGRRAVEAERDRAAAALRALNETLEQRVAERTAELMLAEEQLRQSQKMEAVGQLTGGLAHDFNNLLTGITGSLELLGTRVGQGRLKDLERYITAAQGAAKRAAALTHRLLAFSRRQTLDPKPTDVNRLVAGMEELIRRTVGPGITIEVVGAAGAWPTLVDPPQLESALLNLCINARDAMPDGGRLTVETANRWLDQRAARDRDLAPGQYVSLCVSDTGAGMTPDVASKAFDPFFTTKPLGQGTGLGLSMIYGFVRQSGGQVRIYTELGQGTMVCLYLPRHLGEADTVDAAPELADAPRATQGETVLVVDDEPTVRMLVAEVLEELGYAAIEATDGAAGLRVLRSNARIDLLVTDVGLPGGMNGRQMADAARVNRPALKVLFITGYAENAAVGNGHLAPGMHVMTKPFSMEALASRIRDVILAR